MPSRGETSLAERRDRARRLATTIVSIAIGVLGVTLLLFAFFLTYRGGPAFLFLSIILFVAGAGLALLGFFFQLVPFRVAQLAEEKREYDRQQRP